MMANCCNKDYTELDRSVDYPLKTRDEVPSERRKKQAYGQGPDEWEPAMEPEEGDFTIGGGPRILPVRI